MPFHLFAAEFGDGVAPDGFTLLGLEPTSAGLALFRPGALDAPCFGVLESPVLTLRHPANAVIVSWKWNARHRTSGVEVRLSASADGTTWTPWTTVQPGPYEDHSDLLPDGTPNPLLGYVSSEPVQWGKERWRYLRYTVSLYSETTDQPALGGVRVDAVDTLSAFSPDS